MDSTNCEVIDVELRYPPGVKSIIGQGVSSFIGLLEDGETVLKYPLFPDDRFRIEIEHSLLEHAGKHPRIIESRGLTEDGLLLEYAKNGTLADYILEQQQQQQQQQKQKQKQKQQQEQQKANTSSSTTVLSRLQLCRQIAEGLVHLHSRSVFHSDLRPANILLDENFDVKLADIQGVLKSSSSSPNDGDTGGRVILDGLARESSMYYMPRDDGDRVDAKTDLFAFGSTMHFVMTGGEAVFPDLVVDPSSMAVLCREDDDEIEDEIARRFVQQEYPTNADSYPCASLVQRCWRGDYASADEVLAELNKEVEAIIGRQVRDRDRDR